MSRFNTENAAATVAKKGNTINKAGAPAYSQSDELALASLLLTNMVKDQFYRKADTSLTELKDLLGKVDPLFAAKAAIYARKTFGMRSITHAMAAEIGNSVKGEQWTKDFFKNVIFRPDDITEILAYFIGKYGDTIPNSMKKGLGAALSVQNEYGLSKYSGAGKGVSMIDAVRLTHPKTTEAIQSLMKGTLKTADTWEANLSQAGNAGDEDEVKEAKAEVWESMISSRKIGYFALLRNLRNIVAQANDATITAAAEMLQDEGLITNPRNLVMPFRFYKAYKALRGDIDDSGYNKKEFTDVPRQVIVALNNALDIVVKNVPKFGGKTLIAVDISGSMAHLADISGLFAAAMFKASDSDVVLFHGYASFFNLNPADSVLSLTERLSKASTGGFTNMNAVFDLIKEKGKVYDRIVFLTDMQSWVRGEVAGSSLKTYKSNTGADPFIYEFDLAGYGTSQFNQNNSKILSLAGYSDEIFKVMGLLEQDRNALTNAIKAVEV